MSKHTPGPWTASEVGLIHTVSGTPVAHMSSPSLLAGSLFEAEANARLIAASPDLLKTAKLADQRLAARGDLIFKGNTRGQLRAAIAKAEGGE